MRSSAALMALLLAGCSPSSAVTAPTMTVRLGTGPEALAADQQTRAALREAIASIDERVRRCYARTVVRPDADPPAGRVTVRFVVDPEGEVADARVHESDFESVQLHACVLELFYGLELPAPESERSALVHYPFVFGASSLPYSVPSIQLAPEYPEAVRLVLAQQVRGVVACVEESFSARFTASAGAELTLSFRVRNGWAVSDFRLEGAPPAIESVSSCMRERIGAGLELRPDVNARVEIALRFPLAR